MMANIWSTYNFRLGGIPGFRVGAGVNYQSKSYSDLTNVNSIPSYAIVNMLLGYEAPTWGVSINIHNLNDRHYFIAANVAGTYVGEPRSAMLNVHANF